MKHPIRPSVESIRGLFTAHVVRLTHKAQYVPGVLMITSLSVMSGCMSAVYRIYVCYSFRFSHPTPIHLFCWKRYGFFSAYSDSEKTQNTRLQRCLIEVILFVCSASLFRSFFSPRSHSAQNFLCYCLPPHYILACQHFSHRTTNRLERFRSSRVLPLSSPGYALPRMAWWCSWLSHLSNIARSSAHDEHRRSWDRAPAESALLFASSETVS